MDVQETRVRQLLEGSKQYLVPLYQRPYAWEGKQRVRLWSDILALVEERAVEEDATHFMGSLVLSLGAVGPNGSEFLVVDGQQRLTTISILLCALANAEIHADEKSVTAAGFLTRAAALFSLHGIKPIERVITDNAFAYRHSIAFKTAVVDLGARQKYIKPHCPWQNGKVKRFNRTFATEWAYRQPFTSNAGRAAALAAWIEHYNTKRIHTGHGMTPAAQVSPT